MVELPSVVTLACFTTKTDKQLSSAPGSIRQMISKKKMFGEEQKQLVSVGRLGDSRALP